MSLKHGFALLDEGFRGFLVVGGLARARMMDRFAVETGFQRHRLGVVDVALDVAERNRRSLRQRYRELTRGGLALGSGTTLVTMPRSNASFADSTGESK